MSTATAKNKQPSSNGFIAAWLTQHKDSLKFSLFRLWLNPISTWITLTAIALALTLPTGLHLLLKNLESLTDDNREIPTISLFLKPSVTLQQAMDRAALLSELPEIHQVTPIPKEEGLEKFNQITGFPEIMETLDDNPLPHVLVITPHLSLLGDSNLDMDSFSRTLKSFPEVDNIQIDIEWVQRLRGIIRIAERIIMVVSILLGLTVLLVIGNTIRLDIENRKEEIEINRLIGATNSYIRRPFLYGGIWYGLFGGILSLVIIHISLLFLVTPVDNLATLYGSHFAISGVGFFLAFIILITSAMLGLLGAWLAVGRHLQKLACNPPPSD